MHTYLRAIGLSNINTRRELDKLIGEVMTRPTSKYEYNINKNERYIEISKDYAEGMGITLRGYYDNKGFFHLDHYFPYLKPLTISVQEKVYLNKRSEKNAYNVLCDDMQLGVALVFYLLNTIEYLRLEESSNCFVKDSNVFLSGLCNSGIILLPVMQDDKMIKRRNKKIRIKRRLIAEAKKGNQHAIDSLSINDIDTCEKISKRTKYQDVYTIVENSFYPSGIDNDVYTMVGTIMEIYEITNQLSKEEIYKFIIECNNVYFSVCINKKDLIGVPSIGTRFKGNIWLQGRVDF